MTRDDALARLMVHDHGVLSTLHPDRGVDSVPVVYAVDAEGFLGVPVDRVKPKSSTRLQRERNLESDQRATLLIDHWDRRDWSRLWWVRAQLDWQGDSQPGRADSLAALLATRYPQYKDRPFERVLVFQIVMLTGWSAGTDQEG